MNETSKSLAALRKNYTLGQLSEDDVPKDPIALFETWFAQASRAECPEPNAMVLATANAAGTPSARVVLLKGLSHGDFCFFTNYESQKGKELAERPQASLLFHWHELERQVRISGVVSKLSTAESDEYYLQRPAASRIGAWASPQSKVIESRTFLEQEELRFQKQFGDNPIRPPQWGGYRLKPNSIEFWQGRPSRLHDRILYTRDDSSWQIVRLAP
jgi:pyridoxamine 5'-phosphate oxidase